jgi:hypothetical protein
MDSGRQGGMNTMSQGSGMAEGRGDAAAGRDYPPCSATVTDSCTQGGKSSHKRTPRKHHS